MNRPQWNRQKVESILKEKYTAAGKVMPKVILLGVRGYFENSMGKPGVNDRGIYDDAMFIYAPNFLKSFNANTDPSRSGFNDNAGKGFAVLQPGIWLYKIGIHGMSKPKAKQYRAFIQAGKVSIKRDGYDDTDSGEFNGFFGVNIHRGGINGTSSEGCQTIVTDQWADFFSTAEGLLDQYDQNIIDYVLIEQQG